MASDPMTEYICRLYFGVGTAGLPSVLRELTERPHPQFVLDDARRFAATMAKGRPKPKPRPRR